MPFAGYPEYLKAAALALGHPEAASRASTDVLLHWLSGLVSQVLDPDHAAGILGHAREFRDAMCVAALTGQNILHEAQFNTGQAIDPPLLAPPLAPDQIAVDRTRYEYLLSIEDAWTHALDAQAAEREAQAAEDAAQLAAKQTLDDARAAEEWLPPTASQDAERELEQGQQSADLTTNRPNRKAKAK